LEQALQAARFLPCGPTQQESSGWAAPRGAKSLVLLESVGGQLIFQLCTEKRPLPSSAVKEAMQARIEQYKEETGQERASAKIKKAIKEEKEMAIYVQNLTNRHKEKDDIRRKAIKDKEMEKEINNTINKLHLIQNEKGVFNEPSYSTFPPIGY
jgi:hypothetical protein